MMAEGILGLALFAVVATITPGGATTLATASGAHFGFRRSIPLVSGIAVGLASMAAAAAIGLAGLLLAAPAMQLVMKTIGSVYLLWLAWKIARSGAPQMQTSMAKPTSFVGGVWLLWHNPKGWAVTMSAASAFAGLANGPVQLSVLLGLVFCVAAVVSLSLWCLTGFLLSRLLHTEQQWRLVNRTLGFILVISIGPIWLE